MIDFYWYTAIASTAVLVVIIFLNILGIDFDEIDFDIDGFSINSLVGFFCVGGWTGFLALEYTTFPQWAVLAISAFAGITTYIGSIFLIRKVRRFESSGNILLENAIGKIGKVYLGIPERNTGVGQVEIVIQGRMKIVNAVSNADKIETGEKVIIYDVHENKLVVEPYNEEI